MVSAVTDMPQFRPWGPENPRVSGWEASGVAQGG